MHTYRKSMAAVLLVALAAGTSGAQQVIGPKFQGWLGCWSGAPEVDGVVSLVVAPTLVCITPTLDPNAVDVSTISNGKILSTQKLDASGQERPLEAKGCTGVQSATWSADERRIYLKSSAQCGGMPRTTSGILAMSPKGEWLDVQQVTAGGGENVRVMRYHDAGLPNSVPAEILDVLSDRGVATQGARIAAGAMVGRSAVLEASRAVPPAVVEAWVLERGQPFALDAEELIALADAGVSPRVTDAMVAVSNPKEFAVSHRELAMPVDTTVVGSRLHVYLDRNDPFAWGYDPYGYYGYGYRRGYGYNGYGYGGNPYGNGYNGYGYGYGAPVIVVTRETEAPHGRRVKGEGYQPPSQSGASTSRAVERDRSSSSSSGSSSSGSSSSGSPSSAGSSQPAPSSARTAQPKP
jgi:hypothetical protein